jgi:diguanylate cyclase (GGDEF)-like protein
MENKKVLIIDEKSGVSERLTPLLQEQKCQVSLANGGLAGVRKIYEEKPDIIFLYASINELSTYQISSFLKNNFDFRDIPLVLVGKDKSDTLNLFRIKDGVLDYVDVSQNLDRVNQQIKAVINKHSQSFVVSKSFRMVEQLSGKVKSLPYFKDVNDINSDEFKDVLNEIVSQFTAVLESEIGSFMVLDESQGTLSIKGSKGLNEEIASKARVKLGEGISGWVASRNRPILVTDIEQDNRFSRLNHNRYYTKSLLSAPLRLGKVKGVININNKSSKQAYNEKDLTLLSMLVNHLNSTIENSKLFEEIEVGKKELKKLETDKKILSEINTLLDKELQDIRVSYEINKILNSDLDYAQTINAVIELIESSVDYHFCGLLLLDNKQEAELMVSIKYPASEFDLSAFKAKAIDTYYQLSGYNILLEKIALNRTDGPAILVSEDKKNKNVINSFHAIPLNMKNKSLGLLAVSHSRPEAFGQDELKLLSIIADHSILALNNASLHNRIKKLSITDGLTGLYVYRYFQDKLEEELRRAQRYQEQLSIIVVDIDGFKEVNDNHGHLVGDMVLKEISQILRNVCREVDIIARYGGDEFVVILPQTDREGSFYLAERARKTIKSHEFQSPEHDPIKLTVSCGVASLVQDLKNKDELIKKADEALYRAKNEGKNKTALNQI